MEDKNALALFDVIARSADCKALLHVLGKREHAQQTPLCIDTVGLERGVLPFLLRAVSESLSVTQWVICKERASAEYLYADLTAMLPADRLFYFPSTYHATGGVRGYVSESAIHRMEVIERQSELQSGALSGALIVSTVAGACESFVNQSIYRQESFSLKRGELYSLSSLCSKLDNLGFERAEFVFRPGQYANRGSIIDLFSYSDATPYRLDFLGDSLDSIRNFDVESQLSTSLRFEEIKVVPYLGGKKSQQGKRFLFDILDANHCILWEENLQEGLAAYAQVLNSPSEEFLRFVQEREGEVSLSSFYMPDKTFLQQVARYTRIAYGDTLYLQASSQSTKLTFHSTPQPSFSKNFSLLGEYIREEHARGGHTYILAAQESQRHRLEEIMQSSAQAKKGYSLVSLGLSKGFVLPQEGVSVFTDHQLFDRYHVARYRKQMPRRDSESILELTSLQSGDYVVHVDHGVGVYEGLIIQEEAEKRQEYVRLRYRDRDTLLVSIHNLHRLSKYHGQDGVEPTLHKLGSSAWARLKIRAKKRVEEMARELIALYAERSTKKGYAFSPDTYLQEALEASFQYEDTPDQLCATQQVKQDMESSIPMDRLVCGDVGFGKTEVAIRAAFKAVTDGKQVAVLVPTTVLALQHYNTFCDRLEGFPCNVDYVSRLKTPSERREVLKQLASGTLDIVIGTHALLSKQVVFKDLGLLIIDEEHKFGVKAKEHFRMLRTEVDTLALSATPIPRTLQFSLMGARDFSVIRTPPPNRYPIETVVCTFDRERVAQAIRAEMQRGGQIFFVHNQVHNLTSIETILHELIPEARVGVGHGQMKASHLEQVMHNFMHGDYDVLLCTSIIESGLDIPNANTIIIHNAHRFGLSDLHQLRGRVGRSNRKAYCYLLVPSTEILTSVATRRLRALVDYSDLGSGFSISMQDLDIRGAGNLLGAEQSGFILDLGYETYQQILNEALHELQTTEYAELYAKSNSHGSTLRYSNDCIIETDLDILIPEDYVSNPSERIRLYREIDALGSEHALEQFTQELRDRYGVLPLQVENLLRIPPLRWQAMTLGIEKIILKNSTLRIYFISIPESTFYQSEVFHAVLGNIARLGNRASLKQKSTALQLVVRRVSNVEEVNEVFTSLQMSV